MNNNTIKIKDFVLSESDITEKVKKEKQKNIDRTPDYSYSVVLQNDSDFVLNRKTKTTDRDLVFITSQGSFYFKDNKTDTITKLTKHDLSVFFKFITSESIKKILFKVKIFNEAYWNGGIEDRLLSISLNKNYQKMCKYKIFTSSDNLKRWIGAFEVNPKLFQHVFEKIYINSDHNPNAAKNKSYFIEIVTFAMDICERVNYNNAIEFIDKLLQSSVVFNVSKTVFNVGMILENNLNLSRFIDYILFDLYSQGINQFTWATGSTYFDYLDMQKKFYGGIKEKYPKYLKTEHDIIALKLSLFKRYDKPDALKNFIEKNKHLEYQGEIYSIVIPENVSDIINEGVNLCHCVGDYVDKVVNNETTIVFLRCNEDIEKSLVTIQINNEGIIVQKRGFSNSFPTKEELLFIDKWALLNGLRSL